MNTYKYKGEWSIFSDLVEDLKPIVGIIANIQAKIYVKGIKDAVAKYRNTGYIYNL